MSENEAIDILAAVGESKSTRSTAVRLKNLPKPVRRAVNAWIKDRNVELDAITDPVRKVVYGRRKAYFVISFYADNPEVYTGVFVVQGSNLTGESSGGSS